MSEDTSHSPSIFAKEPVSDRKQTPRVAKRAPIGCNTLNTRELAEDERFGGSPGILGKCL
jgi:hypothetical protein